MACKAHRVCVCFSYGNERQEAKSFISKAMPAFANVTTLFSSCISAPHKCRHHHFPVITASLCVHRRHIATALAALVGLQATAPPLALAQSWGTRSFIKERYFEPGLSAEEAVARIRQTAEGLHSIREMLETMSWRYVIFYIRLKSAYLSQDLKTAMSVLPQARQNDFVNTANELVDNMAEVCTFVTISFYYCFIIYSFIPYRKW